MRQFSMVILPVDGGFHPGHAALVEDPDVHRVAVEHLNRLADGTGVALFRLRGDEERAAQIFAETEDVLSFDVTSVDGGMYVYLHFEASGLTDDLLQMTQEYELVIDTPLEAADNGGVRVTLIGEEEQFREAVEGAPEGIRLELEQITDYRPDAEDPLLTDRQREILAVAVDQGYYDVPRRASRDDLAETLDLSGSTVSEHLRKIETKVLADYVN